MKTLGKYEIMNELGAGAMGKVFRGRDRVLQREVAIKTIATEDADVELRQRFYREARACGRLNHPNIVTVFDLGEQQSMSYIAMEYLIGEDLRRFIDRKAFMPLEGKLQVISEVCDGLAHAHENRIIHRDIKPSNIFMLNSGRPKILDFGIARVWASQLTRVGNAIGTPEYMAPEQIRGNEADARSDIFSAAVVFFELLTNTHPFGETDIPKNIVHEAPKSLRELNPLLPEKMEQILNRAMSKDPGARFQSAAELAKSVRKVMFEVIGRCDQMITEMLKNRQVILDSWAAISDIRDTPRIRTAMADAKIDLSLTDRITPEMARTTGANLHYFSLCEIGTEMARMAEVLGAISADHARVRDDLNKAELQNLALAEPTVRAQATRVVTSPRPATSPEDELAATRNRISRLLEEDVDKCLAEIEILPPAMAEDSVIESCLIRALSLQDAKRNLQVTPVHQENLFQTPVPVQERTIAEKQSDRPTQVEAVLESADTPEFVSPLSSKKIWWVAGSAAALVLIVLVGVSVNRGSTAKSPEVAPPPVAADLALAKAPEPVATAVAPVVVERPKPPAPAPAARSDWTAELRQATTAFDNGEYVTAISLCDKILRVQPTQKQAQALRKRALDAQKLEQSLENR